MFPPLILPLLNRDSNRGGGYHIPSSREREALKPERRGRPLGHAAVQRVEGQDGSGFGVFGGFRGLRGF